jgi:hypothetical protein
MIKISSKSKTWEMYDVLEVFTITYLKNKIRVQEQQVELCEIPRIGGMKR